MTEKDAALVRAEKYVKTVRDFWYHFMVFVLVNAMLVIVDLGGGANAGFLGMDFAYWLILFWGFGIAGHAIYVFAGDHRVSKVYSEEREREMSRH